MTNWNYRVIEFTRQGCEPWSAIHEVYYTGDKPTSYSATAAVLHWDTDEGLDSPRAAMTRMQEALLKPPLKAEDFGDSSAPG